MKSTPALAKAREKMMPGKITRDGFLGDDARSVSQIIEDDEGMMASLSLEWDAVAARLRSFIEEGKKGLGGAVTIDKDWSVSVEEFRGKLPCPFGDGLHPKHCIEIIHIPTGKKTLLSELSLHLLSAHHFLEGKGSSFRIEPAELKVLTAITK